MSHSRLGYLLGVGLCLAGLASPGRSADPVEAPKPDFLATVPDDQAVWFTGATEGDAMLAMLRAADFGEHEGREQEDIPGNGTGKWYMDDTNSTDKDLIPWDASDGYIYDSDRPGNGLPAGAKVAFLMYYNFRQWARVRIKKVQGEKGEWQGWQDCSDFFYWHAHRTTDAVFGFWRESTRTLETPYDFVNHVGEGLLPYGPLPPELGSSMITITKEPPLPDGTVDADYPGTTITATPPSAFPNTIITFDVLSGELPPGLSMENATGEISGTPIVAGTYNFTVVAKSTDQRVLAATKDYTIVITAP